MYTHQPVLLEEVLSSLHPESGQNFVDATLGGGGYSRALLLRVEPDGRVLSIDLDQDAIANYGQSLKGQTLEKRALAVHGNFRDIDKVLARHHFPAPDGIVADIGLSSYQIDESGRGLSFQKHEPLDMRFDQRGDTITAAFILNNYDDRQLTKIFREYGEERHAQKIARDIVRQRAIKPLHYTTDLTELIQSSLPKPVKHKWRDTARRIFQALRIAVNYELDNLQEFLPKAFDLLKPGGRLAVVTFHSLEDRIVKQYFVSLTKGCVCPLDFPECRCGRNPQGKLLNKKPVTAGAAEQEKNPRSLSAKLRAIQKI
jgi:16S rRNA (cytosine1402-N4)-methyltransferase